MSNKYALMRDGQILTELPTFDEAQELWGFMRRLHPCNAYAVAVTDDEQV